jgi:ribonuclease P protein component
VGFTVTKKVGNAVIRNRVRRRLKAVAAEVLPDRVMPGQDIVIIGRMATIKRRYAALLKDLETSLRKLNDTGNGAGKVRENRQGHKRGGGTAG